MINESLNYLWEGSLCLALAFVFFKAFLEKLTFFNWNRAILLFMLISALVVPLLSFELAPNQTGIQEITLPVFWVGEQIQEESGFWIWSLTWQESLFGVYVLGLIVAVGRLSLGLIKPIFQLQMVEKFTYQGMKIAVHPSFEPASFFNYILLPNFDPENPDLDQILLHESVHVEKKHTWDLLLLQFAKAIFWFNPLIFLYERTVREVHEFQADQGVTKSYSQIAYSRLLLRLLTKQSSWQFVNSFNQFQTKKRIIMMTKTNSKTIQKARFLLVLPLLAMFLFVFSCEMTEQAEIEGPIQVAKRQEIGPGSLSARITEGADEIFDVTEEMPVPPGGIEGWTNFLLTNVKYPAEARKMGLEGTVIVVFEIHQDGSVHNPEILRGVSEELDQEALRVVSNSPDWTPGKQRGREVKTRMRLPVRFSLGNSEFTAVEIPDNSPSEISEVNVVAKN
ncbi:MAG: M56 family metallopeptidase [Algoriphagus sp.]|nr:M56 family metallopeptidase [Algoriphagus sp.]